MASFQLRFFRAILGASLIVALFFFAPFVYADAVEPTVTSSAADNITAFGADLHGEITDNGGDPVTVVGFEWDIDSGAPYDNDWHGTTESYDAGGSGAWSVYGQSWRGETFTPTFSHYISSIVIPLHRQGDPGEVTASIQITVDGEPVGFFEGVDLCSGVTDGDTLPVGISPFEWRVIDFDTPYYLIAGSQYVLIVKGLEGDASNYITWQADQEGATYTGGVLVYSGDSGFSWHTESDRDFLFVEYTDGAFTHTFDDMPVETTIYWRAYATNGIGTGYSDELFFDTLLPLPLAPANFVVEQTDIGSVGITWAKGTYADTTIIVVKEDSYPFDYTDGYVVYNDVGESATDDGYNFTYATYYWRAWSHNDAGYSADYAESQMGGEMILQVGIMALLGLIGLVGMIMSSILKKKWLMIFAGGAWLVLAAMFYQLSAEAYDLYWALCMLFIGVGIVCLFSMLRRGEKPKRRGDSEAFDDEADDDESDYPATKQSLPISSRAKRRSRPSRFSQTGEL